MSNNNLITSEVPITVGGRLRYWRKFSALRLVDLAALISVSQGSLSDLENDKSLPSATTLTGLCKKTDMNICWLLTGEGDITREPDRGDAEISAFQDFMRLMQDREFRKTAIKLMNIFEKGSLTQKAQIKGFLAGVEAESI